MRIFITNIVPQTLTNKLSNLSETFGEPHKKIRHELISKDLGLFIVENNNITQLETTFITDYELIKNYKGHNLLVDKNKYRYIKTVSQLPVEYINSQYTVFEYKTDKKSKLSLIVECFEEKNNFNLEIIPVNFYFDYNSDTFDLYDSFFQEEFNMFLSELN